MNTQYIWTDENRSGGKPCLRGHRIPVDQLVAEIESHGVEEVAKDFDLNVEELRGMLRELNE